jgi:2-dehydro-3-deoxyphosphogluconate aldolase/(4S)-4-hydroxy-2-oxoglutarate aldolase
MKDMSRTESLQTLCDNGLVAVVRLLDAGQSRPVIDALAAGDVRAFEITMTTPNALATLTAVTGERSDRLLVGAGTVLDAETARLAILAGARFIVSPTLHLSILHMCHRYDVTAVLGAYTPTEILTAWESGADLVKVFPASSLGPGYLKELKGPLPQLRLMPTGGVTLENVTAFIAAGAVAVGVGGALMSRDAVASGKYGLLTESARRWTKAIRAAKERPSDAQESSHIR